MDDQNLGARFSVKVERAAGFSTRSWSYTVVNTRGEGVAYHAPYASPAAAASAGARRARKLAEASE